MLQINEVDGKYKCTIKSGKKPRKNLAFAQNQADQPVLFTYARKKRQEVDGRAKQGNHA